jgi:Escherichia/Staphylococcus phage prohead protease
MPRIELRKRPGGTADIGGTATVYATRYSMGSHDEIVTRTAAAATLARSPDVLLRIEHRIPIARTPDSLRLWEDGRGLHFNATVDPVNDADAKTAVSRIERGVYTQSSFAFRVPPGGDEWNSDFTLRTINRFDLDHGDVAICAHGANPSTSLTAGRSALGLLERRSLAMRISSTGWCGPGLLRQMAPDASPDEPDDDGQVLCIHCAGRGRLGDGGTCPICGGAGRIPDDADEDGGEDGQRSDYSDADKARLGKAGKAVWIDGHWAFPVGTKADFDDAARALGRTPGKNRAKVRRYLIGLAKKNGWDYPASWAADGSLKRSSVLLAANDTAELKRELYAGLGDSEDLWREWEQLQLRHSKVAGRRR